MNFNFVLHFIIKLTAGLNRLKIVDSIFDNDVLTLKILSIFVL